MSITLKELVKIDRDFWMYYDDEDDLEKAADYNKWKDKHYLIVLEVDGDSSFYGYDKFDKMQEQLSEYELEVMNKEDIRIRLYDLVRKKRLGWELKCVVYDINNPSIVHGSSK